jgi:predicted alpha/beta hydrolase
MKQSFQKESFSTQCSDGVTLKGLLLIPEKPKGVVQFSTGTAAKKEFYLSFLEFLCADGYICCLWDYRGSGESAPLSLKGCDYRFQDYGLKDMPAIKDYLTTRFPEYPFFLMGHSAGGQQMGFMHNLSGVKAAICFAVSVGYRKTMPWKDALLYTYFFYIFTPISILFTGYIAAKRFGIMEDLPKNVLLEWRDWCSRYGYFFNKKFYGKSVPVGQFQNYNFPIHVYRASDDAISNKDSVPIYWSFIKSSQPIDIQGITPEQYKVKSIGHFGFFKKNLKDTFWQDALNKLNSFLHA